MRVLLVVIVVVAASVVALVGLLRRARAPQRDLDLDLLVHLAKAGSDFSKLHPVEFFLYFPAEGAARKAGSELEQLGYKVQVRREAQANNWLCLGTKALILRHDTMVGIRAQLQAVGAKSGGAYDGWGTSVVK